MNPQEIHNKLVQKAAQYSLDPYKFALFAFPWGEPGTPLEKFLKPEDWQSETLQYIRDCLINNPHDPIRISVSSGHGIGKSALIAMIINWAMTTCPDTKGTVTAGKEDQLRTKTWPEVSKWHRMSLYRDWFNVPATSMYSANRSHEKTWRIDAQAWNAARPEAFAGMHNKGRRIIIIYDEASAVDDIIWETTEGALTDSDTQIIWIAFSNPTKNTGRFRECFGKFKHRWFNKQIDSRSVTITNKDQLNEWVQDYGEDSDFVKVRVRGIFPSASSLQFIGSDIVDQAAKRESCCDISDPLIMGVDVARFGDDQTIISFRKGRDATIIPWVKYRKIDTMQLAAQIVALHQKYRVDAVFVDGGGVGGGVVDRLRMLNVPVIEVQFGSSPNYSYAIDEKVKYANHRAEMWGNMKEWLKTGTIPDDASLREGLTAVEYGYNTNQEILLERKESMKKRGLASPDEADALALTFSMPIISHDNAGRPGIVGNPLVQSEYNPFDVKWDD